MTDKKPVHVIPNDVNLASGTFKGTWTGRRIRIGNITEILTDITLHDINVAVIIVVTKHTIEIYTN